MMYNQTNHHPQTASKVCALPTLFQYRSRFFLRNCSKANFVKTLTLLDSEKVGIIGTRFSTIPGDFEQGRQEIILKKLIQNGQKG